MDIALKKKRLALLLGVAERAREEDFDMTVYGYESLHEPRACGTPACLMGHAMVDPVFKRAARGHFTGPSRDGGRRTFFGLDTWEDDYLFSSRDIDEDHCPRRVFDTPAIAAQRVIDVMEAL